MLNPKIVGDVISDFRKQKAMSQEVLSAIERGERKPTLETLYRICTALEIPMSVVVQEIEKRIENT